MDERIRKDFAMEMDYAITQFEKGKGVKPQLSNLGEMMKDVGIGAFASVIGLLAFETLKAWLDLA